MAYTPTIWNENDIITAEKLNNIENGISDLVLNLGQLELKDISFLKELTLTDDQLNILRTKDIVGVTFINTEGIRFFLYRNYSLSLGGDVYLFSSSGADIDITLQINSQANVSILYYERPLFNKGNIFKDAIYLDYFKNLSEEGATGVLTLNYLQYSKLLGGLINKLTLKEYKYVQSSNHNYIYCLPLISIKDDSVFTFNNSISYLNDEGNTLEISTMSCVLTLDEENSNMNDISTASLAFNYLLTIQEKQIPISST